MPDNIVQVTVRADVASVKPAFDNAGTAVQSFLNSAGGATSALDASKNSSNAFSQSIQQLGSAVEASSGTLGKLGANADTAGSALDKAKSSGDNLAETFKKVERNAEFRELSRSIQEGIENPLGAAKNAAEGMLLSLGAVGVGAVGLLAIGGAAFEASLHVGELAHGFMELGGELGIAPEQAQQVSRAFQLLDMDTGTLMMANRTLSRVLEDGTEHGRKIREEAGRLGISFRDSAGNLKPFNDLLLEIIQTLSEAPDKYEANRIGAELLGRTYLRLAGNAKELPEAMRAATGGLSGEAIESANTYEFKWKQIKQSVSDAANEVGLFVERTVVGAASMLGAVKSSVPSMGEQTDKDISKEKAIEAVRAQGAGTAIQANRAIEAALRGMGGAEEEAKKKLTELQEELGKYEHVALDTVTSSGVTVGALIQQINAEKAHIESLKAEGSALKQREATIKAQEQQSLAEIALARQKIEQQAKLEQIGGSALVATEEATAQRRRDVLVGLANDQLAIEQNAINQRIELQKQVISSGSASPERKDEARTQLITLNAELVASKQKTNEQIVALDAKLAEDEARLAATNDKIQEKLFVDLLGAHAKFLKEDEANVRATIGVETKAWLESSKVQEKAIDMAMAAERKHFSSKEELYRRDIEFQASLGLIAASKRDELLQASLNREDEYQRNSLATQLAELDRSDKEYLAKRQALVDQLQALDDKMASRRVAADNQATKTMVDRYKSAIDMVGNDFQSGVMQWIRGTKSFGQAFSEMGKSMVTDFIGNLIKMEVKNAEHWAVQKAVHASAVATEKALDTAGAVESEAIEKTSAAKSIFVSAKKAYAAVSANEGINSIPFVGPALAQAAGAAAFAGIMSLAAFEQGGIVGSDQLAMVHKNEMVLPAHISQSVQAMANGGREGGGQGGDTHYHYHGAPGENPNSIRQNQRAFADMAKKMLRAQNITRH